VFRDIGPALLLVPLVLHFVYTIVSRRTAIEIPLSLRPTHA
jgi:hypothetical protein